MMKILLCSVAFAALLFFACSKPSGPDDNTATGSETGNVALTGKLYHLNGLPAKNARVQFITVDHNPSGLGKVRTIADTVTTDTNGNYSVDSLLPGEYNIFGDLGSELAYVDSIIVSDSDTVVPPDTLKAPGSLAGTIELEPGDDRRTLFVILFGTTTSLHLTDSLGRFALSNMAEGPYSVRILTTLDTYEPKDTSLAIRAGLADTAISPIRLRYKGIPIPKNLQIQYDTLKQLVTLTWNRPTTGAPVSGYNIYRKNQDSSLVLLKPDWQDTVFSDSTAIQDQTYEYRLAALDTQNTEGVKTAAVSVKIVSAFSLSDSLILSIRAFDMVNMGGAFILLDTNKTLSIYDTSLKQITSAKPLPLNSSTPLYLKEGPSQTFYCLSDSPQVIYQLNQNGDTLKTWKIDSVYVNDFAYYNDSLYLSYHSFNDRYYNHIGKNIGKFAITDSVADIIPIDSATGGYYKGIAVDQENIYLAVDDYSSGYGIEILNKTTRNVQHVILDGVVGGQILHYRLVISQGKIYLLYYRNYLYSMNEWTAEKVFILEPAGTILTSMEFSKEREMLSIQIDADGTLYCLTNDQKILKYSKR